MKHTLRRISGKIVVEDVETIEQTKGSIHLKIKNALAQTSIECELKEFEIEIKIPPIFAEKPKDMEINDVDFFWNLQGKFDFGKTRILTTEFLKNAENVTVNIGTRRKGSRGYNIYASKKLSRGIK